MVANAIQSQDRPSNLYAKLAWIMGEIKRIPKNGTNPRFNYKFATDGDVADTIRSLLAEANVAFFPSMTGIEREELRTANGGSNYRTRAYFEMTFVCGDTGEARSCNWLSEADDTQDKGINKAATAAVKYFLLKTFIVSTGDEVDDPDAGRDGDGKKSNQKKDGKVTQFPQQKAQPQPTYNAGSNALKPQPEDKPPVRVSTQDAKKALNGTQERRVGTQPEALQTFVPEGHIAFHTARFSKPKSKEIVTFIGGTTAMDHIEVTEYVEDGVIGALGIKGYPYEFIQAWNDKQQIQHRDYPLSPNLFASVTIKGGNGQDRNNRRIGEIKSLKKVEEDGDAEPEDRHHKAVATAARGFVDGSKKGVIFKTNVGEIKAYSREEMRRDLSEAWVEYAGQLKDKPGENHTFVLDGMPDLEVLYVVRKSSKPGERATEYKQVVGYRALSIDEAAPDSEIDFNK